MPSLEVDRVASRVCASILTHVSLWCQRVAFALRSAFPLCPLSALRAVPDHDPSPILFQVSAEWKIPTHPPLWTALLSPDLHSNNIRFLYLLGRR